MGNINANSQTSTVQLQSQGRSKSIAGDMSAPLPPPLPQRQLQHGKQQQQQQQPQLHSRPLVRRSSSHRGYHPRSASLRRMRSIQRRRILETSNAKRRPPSKRSVRQEADNRKVQEEKSLLSASARGDLKKVEKLVDSGVDVNAADTSQMTALHFAAMHAREDVIKSLISRGAEVNVADLKGGFTAMHWVVINAEPQYGSTDRLDKSLTTLAKAGCKVNATDFNFATPLHIAAQKGNNGCVQTLMRLGADPMKVDITGRNCFEVAKCDQTRALLKRLHQKYSRESQVLQHDYQVLEIPPPTVPAPAPPTSPPLVPPPPPPSPPVPPPRLVSIGKSRSADDHVYHTPEFTPSPPSSPASSASSMTPPPPPQRRKQFIQYSKDTHIYQVLEIPAAKERRSRLATPPRRRKSRKHKH